MPKPPRSFLSVTKRIGEVDVPVTQIELEHGIKAGIQLRVLTDGLVPLHEEHEARLERGILLRDWETMEYMEKALIVAQRRIRNAVHNLQNEAEIKTMERKSRRRK